MKITKYLILLLGLKQVAWVDRRNKRISNRSIGMLLSFRSILLLLEYQMYPDRWSEELIQSVAGLFFISTLFLWLYFCTEKAIGAGDIKLLAVIASYVGSEQTLWIVFLASIYAFAQAILKNGNLKTNIPFGPYIFYGTVTIFFYVIVERLKSVY